MIVMKVFPFDFKPNGFPVGSKSKGKLSPRSYPIQCERKWKYSFLNVECYQNFRPINTEISLRFFSIIPMTKFGNGFEIYSLGIMGIQLKAALN